MKRAFVIASTDSSKLPENFIEDIQVAIEGVLMNYMDYSINSEQLRAATDNAITNLYSSGISLEEYADTFGDNFDTAPEDDSVREWNKYYDDTRL